MFHGDIINISWTSAVEIQKKLFYVNKVLENNSSCAVLLNWLITDLYEWQGKAIINFSNQLPIPHGDLAQEMTKDPYGFSVIPIGLISNIYETFFSIDDEWKNIKNLLPNNTSAVADILPTLQL